MNEVKVIEVFINNAKIGRIAMTTDSLCAFEYDSDYLLSGDSIYPFYLPLKKEVFIAKRNLFNGGFGVFEDSLPDGWGNLIINRYLRGNGINPDKLTLLQRLALIGSTGLGALEYRPDYSESTADGIINFTWEMKQRKFSLPVMMAILWILCINTAVLQVVQDQKYL